jgi:hypothetical protein
MLSRRLFLVLPLLLAGCVAEITYTELNKAPHAMAQRSADSVAVFTTAPPTQPYVELALLHGSAPLGESRTPWIDAPHIIKRLRRAAGKLGCDGLVIAAGSGDEVRGTCIVYRGTSASIP